MKSMSDLRREREQNRRDKEIALAEAKQLWENPLLQQALDKLDDESIKALDTAPLFGVPFFWRTIQTIMFRQITNRFKKHLRKAITDVAVAEKNTR